MNIPDYLEDHVAQLIATEQETANRKQLWAVILGLAPYPDGDKWCVLWGVDLQKGVAGFGDTPNAAMMDFETAMVKRRC